MRANECRRELMASVTRFVSIAGMVGLILGLGGRVPQVRAEVQNDLVGFSPNHIFDSTDQGEHIDVMTGNLTLTIPIGPRYKLAGNFEHGITLYYNSKIWRHECPLTVPPSVCEGQLPLDTQFGVGFSISPGRVYHHPLDKPYVYRMVLEGGSEHFFCEGNIPENSECPRGAGGFGWGLRTLDGSNIHVQGFGTGWLATLPDGRKIEFMHQLATGEDLATKIRMGTDVWVEYKYTDPENPTHITSIEDSSGRTTTIGDVSNVCGTNNSLGGLGITVPAFAGVDQLDSGVTADLPPENWTSVSGSPLGYKGPIGGRDEAFEVHGRADHRDPARG